MLTVTLFYNLPFFYFKKLSQNIFNNETLSNRVTQSVDFQVYFLCVTPFLCYSVLIFLAFEIAYSYLRH